MYLILGSDSDDDRDDVGEEMLYSIHSPSRREQRRQGAQAKSSGHTSGARPKTGQSKACVMISIKRGRLTLVHPVKVSHFVFYVILIDLSSRVAVPTFLALEFLTHPSPSLPSPREFYNSLIKKTL